ncbi:unnamed protein product [Symbiodinium necroappetens]|uniref:Uncharacterized protein n=1 Tax=Symbiodinium necroappetens TaxID=1628268 RepID=A0A813AN93_9DINO|nr:unnamed protein product [Symbiodinium necroappetens]
MSEPEGADDPFDDANQLEVEEQQEHDGQAAEEGASRGRGRGRGRAKGKAAPKRGGRDKDKNKKCFKATCQEKAKAHSKWCVKHSKDTEAMKYQAKSQQDNGKTLQMLETALGDPNKADLALDEFDRHNPQGRFRKNLIDWSAFERKFGRRSEVRNRCAEELMDVTDYVKHKKDRGVSEDKALLDWKELLETDVDREGEGTDVKVWVAVNKKRFRDDISYRDHSLNEGSKQTKGMNSTDRHMPICCVCPRVEIAIAAPKALEKNEKILITCQKGVTDARKALVDALKLAGEDQSADQLQKAYESNCVVRLQMLDIWAAPSLAQIPKQRPLPSQAMFAPGADQTTAPGTPQPQEAAKQQPDAVGVATEDTSPEAVLQKAAEAFRSATPAKTDAKDEKAQGGGDAATPTPKAPKDKDAVNNEGNDQKSEAPSQSTPGGTAAKLSSYLRKEIGNAGSKAQHVDPLGNLMAMAHMEELLQSFMACDSIDALNKAVSDLKNAAVVVRQLKEGATKAAASLRGHILNRQRAQQRKKQQESKQVENQEVLKKKKEAKTAAEEIKKQEATAPPLFQHNWTDLQGSDGAQLATMIQKNTGPANKSINSFDAPCLICNCSFLADFQKNSKVMLMLGGFGGSYKKNTTLKTVGKCQEMVYKNSGLEECMELWTKTEALFHHDFVACSDKMEKYLTAVLKASWLFGYDSQGTFVGTMPNGLASLRMLCSGEVLLVMFELRQLLPAMKILLGKDDVGGMEGVNTFLKNLSVEEIAKLKNNGCHASYIVHQEGQIVYIPVGYVVAEKCMKGVLVYGLRKTVMPATAMASENYSLLTGLFEESKKPVDKMKATLPYLNPDAD